MEFNYYVSMLCYIIPNIPTNPMQIALIQMVPPTIFGEAEVARLANSKLKGGRGKSEVTFETGSWRTELIFGLVKLGVTKDRAIDVDAVGRGKKLFGVS